MQREKGNREERALAAKLTAAGIPTARQVGSGAHGGRDARLQGDLRVGIMPDDTWLLTGESKVRNTKGVIWRSIEKWLADNDLLILREDRRDPLVVLPWHVAVHVLQTFYEEELIDWERLHGDNQCDSSDVSRDERVHGGEE